MQNNIERQTMTTKRQTLNADKRKVIADVFQSHFEDNSKYKKQHTDAITNYNLMREQAKVKMNDLVRFHQPQEDVDTCLLYTSPSPRDMRRSRMPSSA